MSFAEDESKFFTDSTSDLPSTHTRRSLVGYSHGRPQVWARGGTCPPPPSENVVKCFVHSYSKRSVHELFMHYFHNLSSASGGFVHRPPPGFHPWTPLGDIGPRPLICSPLEKILRAPMVIAHLMPVLFVKSRYFNL